MGAAKALRKIMVDKDETLVGLSDKSGKAYQTVLNTFRNDNLKVSSAIEYGKMLGCSLCYIDDETGEIYKIL